MDIYHTIIRPLVTEKSTSQSGGPDGEAGATYAFQVNLKASKSQIRDAVEKIYGVKVVDVRTLVRAGKTRRFRFRVGQTSGMKKAYVTLDESSKIDLF
ncbi:MAG: 50S ribosomal protein L23 [Planctomycetia bacterium]|nr:MAG: 50S ribosomal protein L23 [Planctomycetia bacterium]